MVEQKRLTIYIPLYKRNFYKYLNEIAALYSMKNVFSHC